jgi:hypothetical protein
MKKLLFIGLIMSLTTSCWPTQMGFKDTGGMPEEWKSFVVQNLSIQASTCPNDYAPNLTEAIKDGIQNNSRLALATNPTSAQVILSGEITGYQVNPIAIQSGDNATKNRLQVSVEFIITTTAPKAEEMRLSISRFADFNASDNLATVERGLLSTINEQIVQDILNKLMSNW